MKISEESQKMGMEQTQLLIEAHRSTMLSVARLMTSFGKLETAFFAQTDVNQVTKNSGEVIQFLEKSNKLILEGISQVEKQLRDTNTTINMYLKAMKILSQQIESSSTLISKEISDTVKKGQA